MANSTVTPTSQTPASSSGGYDPIKMLRDYLTDTKDAPPHFGNYLINRLGDQITWYDKKSGYFKRKWEGSRRWVIILSASIPFLVGLIGLTFRDGKPDPTFDLIVKIVVGTAGVAIAIMEGLNSLYKSQEHYIDYRMTAEKLRQEFSFFMARGGAYTGLSAESAYAQLMTQAEGIMANENNKWAEVTRQKDKAATSEDIQSAVQEYLKKYGVQPAAPSASQPTPTPATPPTTPVAITATAPAATPPSTSATTTTAPVVTPAPAVTTPSATTTQPTTPPPVTPIELLPEEGIDPSDRNLEGSN
ncbi:MAG: DUF4231 domain-containing protein [Saprospiraceae bacterium]